MSRNLIEYALESGFDSAGALNMEALEFMPEVREMCRADICRSYGKNWCCPPALGSLEESAARASKFSQGILLQTVGELEDDFDYESITETESRHKKLLAAFSKELKRRGIHILPMGAGPCTVCESCTYPESPCRLPEEAIPSMEAFGLLVSKVCIDSGMKYNHGARTVCFTGAVLFAD